MANLEKGGFIVLYLLLLLHNESSATPVVKVEKKVTDQQLPRVTLPISYDIKIVPTTIDRWRDPFFHGESRITIRILEETRNVTLHSKYLVIDENFTSLVHENGMIHKAKKHSFINSTRFLVIEFEQPISAGIYTLNLNYTGNMGYGISWHWERTDMEWAVPFFYQIPQKADPRTFVATGFYPSNARTAFPCWDEPDYEATFNLSIKHHPNWTAVSNTPVHQRISDSDGKIWTSFETTPPIPVYRLGFVLSDYDCLRSDDKKFSFCGKKELTQYLKNSLDITQRAIPILERYIGVPCTMQARNEFVTQGHREGSFSAIIRGPVKYRENDFKNINMLSGMENGALTVVRNVAFEFLNDVVTVLSFNSSWIFEGLSYYLGYSVVDKLHSGWREMDSFVMMFQRYGFLADESNSTRSLETLPNGSKGTAVLGTWRWINLPIDYSFIRGAALFHMISNFLTERIFIQGIHEFVKKNSINSSRHSITSDDLWDAMQLAYDKNGKEWNIDVPIKEVMKSWTNQTGYPILKVTRNYETGKVTITQEGYPIKSNRYWIPVNFVTKSNPSFIKPSGWWLDPRVETYVIDDYGNKDDWIIFNIQQSGYYRVDYDETNWNRIAEYMKTKNYKKIHVRNRAQLLNDLSFMVQNGRQNVTTFLNLASYLVRENDFTPWFPISKHVEWLRSKTLDWPIDEQVTKFFLGLMEKVIQKIDFKDNGDYNEVSNTDTKIKTYFKTLPKNQDFFTRRYGFSMKYLACSLGHPSCLESDSDKAWDSYESLELIQPPGRYSFLFCDAAENRTEDDMLKKMENPLNTQYINYLFCSSNKKALWEFINQSLTGQLKPSSMQMETALLYFVHQSDNSKHNNVEVIIKNIDAIFRYYEKRADHLNIEERPGILMTASQLMVRCYLVASTPEQAKEVIDLVAKNPQIISSGEISAKYIEWKTNMFQWQKDNFPEISKWLQDHSINNSPVA